MAKTLECSDSDVKKKSRKGLVKLIKEQLEDKLKYTKAGKLEYLLDFKSQLMEYTLACPPF